MASSTLFIPRDNTPEHLVGRRTDGTFDNQARVDAGLLPIPAVEEAVAVESITTVEGLMTLYGVTPRQAFVWQALIDGATKGLSRHRVWQEMPIGACSSQTFYRCIKQAPKELQDRFPPASYGSWTEESLMVAKAEWKAGASISQIAKVVGRDSNAVSRLLYSSDWFGPRPQQKTDTACPQPTASTLSTTASTKVAPSTTAADFTPQQLSILKDLVLAEIDRTYDGQLLGLLKVINQVKESPSD
jgi:hypothetical protein